MNKCYYQQKYVENLNYLGDFMIISYAFSNFQSFTDRTEVSMLMSGKGTKTHWMEDTEFGRISKVMTVIGPNGSGKTALLKSLAFLWEFIVNSFQCPVNDPIPLMPHAFIREVPSEFECIFNMGGQLWRYELKCTQEKVLHEALYKKEARFRYVFIRDWNELKEEYTLKQQGFGFPVKSISTLRKNASLISIAIQHGISLAQQFSEQKIATNVSLFGTNLWNEGYVFDEAASYFFNEEAQRQRMAGFMKKLDLGLGDVDIEKLEDPNETKKKEFLYLTLFSHQGRNKDFTVPIFLESAGTQSAFVLLYRLLPILENGGIAIIDEFECNMHPLMLEKILNLFSGSKTNPHHAQIIFTCHAPEVLNVLSKSQVTLVEKNEYGESQAYRLDSIDGIRNDDNLYAKYMAGAYGAIPNL